MNYQKNQILEVTIDDMNMMGYGVAKVEGVVFFVQNGVLGEKAKIRIIKVAKNYVVARIEEIFESSSYRVEPSCPVHRRCGGCVFQHINYDLEREIKQKYVESCFQKEGMSNIRVLDVISDGNTSFYRNKAQFPVSKGENDTAVFGFYSGKTHNVVSAKDCVIQDQRFSSIASFVCDYLTKNKIPVYDEENHRGLVRHVYLRRGKETGEIMLSLVLTSDEFPDEKSLIKEVTRRFPEIRSIVFNINPDKTNVVLGKQNRTVWGSDTIFDILCRKRFEISPLSFYQVNHDMAEILYEKSFEMAAVYEHDLVLDLYCGIGTIGICASKIEGKLLGVEIIPEAVENAKNNARMNQMKNATFFQGDAGEAFRIIREMKAENPLVIVDPPRKGLPEDLILSFKENKIKKILYISCGPDTLARDVKRFASLGYSVSDVQPFDLFPRTSHVENAAVLYQNFICV